MSSIVLLLLVLAVLSVIQSNAELLSLGTQTISAAVKDTNVNGLEGLNIKWSVPFNFNDCIVGFNCNLADTFKSAPESIFAKKTFTSSDMGSTTINADYGIAKKVLKVCSKWCSNKGDFSVGVVGNSEDYVTEVSASTTQDFLGNPITVKGTFDILKEKLGLNTKATFGDFATEVDCDSISKNPSIMLEYNVNSDNKLATSISVVDRETSVSWSTKLNGGSVKTKFSPGDKVAVEWNDNTKSGVWSTKADFPIAGGSPKVSFSREWNY